MNVQEIGISLLEEIEAHAVDIALKAGQILLEHFSKPMEIRFKEKKTRDPVTAADNHAEEYLKKAIEEKFSRHGILSEEGGALVKSDSPFVWVLDPLDGTLNFMNGLPLFAVSIGVLWRGQPVVGSIYVPVSHRIVAGVYHACLNRGAYFNNERIEASRISSGHPLSGGFSQFGIRHRLPKRGLKEPYEARNLGSIALELALTACGVFRYAVFGSPKIWDVAAGALLVTEAGGLTFSRSKKGRTWFPLERFPLQPDDEPVPLETLGKWSAPVVAGSPDVVRTMVKDAGGPLLSWPRKLRRRLSTQLQ